MTGPSEAHLDASGAARPSLCRMVVYRGKHGHNAPRGDDAGAVPALSSPMHVHLHVFTPSDQQGWTEYDVPYGDGPGEWSWPPRK